MKVLCIYEFSTFDMDRKYRKEQAGVMIDVGFPTEIEIEFEKWAKKQDRAFMLVKYLPECGKSWW